MYADTKRIEDGMEVFTSDGQKLGKVSHVWPVVDDASSGITSTGYFQVDQGGILGLGAKHLYVPYSAIDDYVAGECVTISCAKSDCVHLYEQQPDFLKQSV
ncbi:MAG: hypothetical protein NVS2B16_08090 [Chloroflexota bacterium]